MVGPIANGVDCESKPYLRSLASKLEELLTVHIEDATIVAFADVWLEHRRSMRSKRAIHEHFDGTDPQPVIPEASAESKLVGLVQQLHRDVLEHTQLQPPLFMKLLE